MAKIGRPSTDSVHRSVRIPRDLLAFITSHAAQHYEGNMNMAVVKLLRLAMDSIARENRRGRR